jgi:hypothetical protein
LAEAVDLDDNEEIDSFTRLMQRREIVEQCLADDAQISPDLARAACEELVETHLGHEMDPSDSNLTSSRYGETYREAVRNAFLSATAPGDVMDAMSVLSDLVQIDALGGRIHIGPAPRRLLNEQLGGLIAEEEFERCKSILAVMLLAYWEFSRSRPVNTFSRVGEKLLELLKDDSLRTQFSTAWALAWIASNTLWKPDAHQSGTALTRLLELWIKCPHREVSRFFAWPIAYWPDPMAAAPALASASDETVRAFIRRQWVDYAAETEDSPTDHFIGGAAVVAFCIGNVWDDGTLIEVIAKAFKPSRGSEPRKWLFDRFGRLGSEALRRLRNEGARSQTKPKS